MCQSRSMPKVGHFLRHGVVRWCVKLKHVCQRLSKLVYVCWSYRRTKVKRFLRQHCIDNNLWLGMAVLTCVQNLAGTGLGVAPNNCKFWNINACTAGMYPLCDSCEIVRICRHFYVRFKFSIWLHLLKGFGFYRGFIFGVYVSAIFLCGVMRCWFICSVWCYIIVCLFNWLPTLSFYAASQYCVHTCGLLLLTE